MVLANMGLTQILKISIPVLNMIYPIAIMLIVIAMLDRFFVKNFLVYPLTIAFTALISITHGLEGFGLKFGQYIFGFIPLYNEGLGWVLPALIAMITSYIIFNMRKSK